MILLGALVVPLTKLGTLPMIVGLIEEAAKLVVPVILVVFARHRYRSVASGIVIGIAVGTGFAVLETMGYAFVALIQSGGNVGAAEETLLIRGLLSPAGHAAWTGLACWGLWRFAIERRQPSARHDLNTRHDLNSSTAALAWPHWSGKLLNQLSDWSIAHSANHAAGGAHERQVSSGLRGGHALTT
ncbi:MAG TPA: PrsW family intramembrane metalloprotease [Kribbella sp.]|jgi:RsiW-degrading membrane proteinase PrsW (M82 family)